MKLCIIELLAYEVIWLDDFSLSDANNAERVLVKSPGHI